MAWEMDSYFLITAVMGWPILVVPSSCQQEVSIIQSYNCKESLPISPLIALVGLSVAEGQLLLELLELLLLLFFLSCLSIAWLQQWKTKILAEKTLSMT